MGPALATPLALPGLYSSDGREEGGAVRGGLPPSLEPRGPLREDWLAAAKRIKQQPCGRLQSGWSECGGGWIECKEKGAGGGVLG